VRRGRISGDPWMRGRGVGRGAWDEFVPHETPHFEGGDFLIEALRWWIGCWVCLSGICNRWVEEMISDWMLGCRERLWKSGHKVKRGSFIV
jgi:hypothetical protein